MAYDYSKWSGHGLACSTEDPRTWQSSLLRRILHFERGRQRSMSRRERARDRASKISRQLCYGILVNRRRYGA